MTWQQIENAPEDVEVLVYAPKERPSVFTAMLMDLGSLSKWSRQSAGIDAQRDDYFGDPDFAPTHWMPLPAPPQSERTGA